MKRKGLELPVQLGNCFSGAGSGTQPHLCLIGENCLFCHFRQRKFLSHPFFAR